MLRLFIFVNIYDRSTVEIKAYDIHEAWVKLAKEYKKENFMLEGVEG
jgi:hypothetical protein